MPLPFERLAAAWGDPDAYATSLLVLFLDRYCIKSDADPEHDGKGLQWDPATIEMEIYQDSGVDLSRLSYDRLMTAIHILSSNAFFTVPYDFARGCTVLAGHSPVQDELIMPGTAEMAWGITEALLIRPPEPGAEERTFAPAIRSLIGEALDHEGLLIAPDVLALGQRRPEYWTRAQSHDPDVWQAAQARSQEQSAALKRYLNQGLVALLEQLQKLPLEHGTAGPVVGPLLERLRQKV